MKLKELINKDVISEQDGTKLGKIYDLELDTASGKILTIFVKEGIRIVDFFKSNNNLEIPWSKIIKIGSDVIIVENTTQIVPKKE